MSSKTILGLDLGTNSIGWSLIQHDSEKKTGQILGMGSRIIPMGAELSKFEQGQAQTKNANRRISRGLRKLNKRYKQRRNKLIYVLQQFGMLPSQIKLSEPFSNPLKVDRISILPIAKNQKQYSATDLLELRVRALYEQVSLEELGKIIYLFNQLRGYSGSGNESEKEDVNEDDDNNIEENKSKQNYIAFGQIISVSTPEKRIHKKKEINISRITFKTDEGSLEGDTFLESLKQGDSLELLVNKSVSKKYGETIFFKLPNKTNWRKKMENLEKQISELSKESGREIYLSEYFLKILKENKWAKIRNNVILRSRYQSEFDAIWKTQARYYNILNDSDKNKNSEIVNFIFPGKKETQAKYREIGIEKGLYHIIRDQIIYYQRELKDQTHLISDCRFEKGKKAIAKSHPIFQEYKIWEQINKLTINTKIEKGLNKKGVLKYDYEDRPIHANLKDWLYVELQEKKEISFGIILNKLKKEYGLRDGVDFLNGINAKAKLKGNDTKLILRKSLGDPLWHKIGLEDVNKQISLWDILYNGKGNEYDIESDRTSKVLTFLRDHIQNLSNIEQVAIQISKIKFSRNYSSLSLEAIEKLLPIVKAGKYFDPALTPALKENIIRLLNENVTDPFEKSLQEFLDKNQTEVLANGGMMNAYATILVYNKHTAKEYKEDEQIKHPNEIKRLKQGELRNPLVEQLISETLVMVKDIWKQYGYKPNEIRLELSRELKNNAERRAKIYAANRESQKANEEVKNLLVEMKQDISLRNIEKYKLWQSQENLQEEYIKQYKDPSKSEVERMRLWKDQGHISPYTGQPIPLSELFNRERYDIDHIIPQSRYFDDSYSNKVICEKSVNKDKGNRTAMEYFENGSVIPSVFTKNTFIDHVNKYFGGIKRKNLLATKVPEDPISRQIKETQYISVRAKEELNKIVGNSNVKTTTGGVTDYLRNQWGLTDKFKNILKSRYDALKEIIAEFEYEKRKDKIDNKESFIAAYSKGLIEIKNNKLVIKGWSKRIDHRHHAIDALIVACTEPKHIKRLNDLNKELQTWLDNNRNNLLPEFEGTPSELLEEILSLDADKRETIFRQIEKSFKTIEMPWPGFPEMAEKEIEKIIISQKPKNKLLIQRDLNGDFQIKMRGQLHEGTLYGMSQGVEAYRIPLTKFAGNKFATEKTIEKIVDKYLKITIQDHLKNYENKKEEAFSAEGILNLNKKLAEKKNKKGEIAPHTPITSVKVFYRNPSKIKKKKNEEEPEDALQRLDRAKAFNKSLYVKTGDNYLFAVLEKEGKRIFDLITFFDAACLLKEEFNKSTNKKNFNNVALFKLYFEEKNKAKLLFTLKQGDYIYLPEKGEDIILDPKSSLYNDFWNNKEKRTKNIHIVTKYSGNRIYFIKHNIANPIIKGKEFGSQNAYEKIDEVSIKDTCIKLEIDRLGNVRPLL